MSTNHASLPYDYHFIPTVQYHYSEADEMLTPPVEDQAYFGQCLSNALLEAQSGAICNIMPSDPFDLAVDQVFANSSEPQSTPISACSWTAESVPSSQTTMTSPILSQDSEFDLTLFPTPPGGPRVVKDAPSKHSELASTASITADGTRKRRRNRSSKTPYAKRELHLEKNRIAANKCRKKQARYEAQLQERLKVEESKRNSLIGDVASLKGSMLSLKEELVLHYGCGDENVRRFLSTELEKAKLRRTSEADAKYRPRF
jgi:hypothetical protein